MKRKIYKNQSGVALLFAIGILSLLMFLGLAFVTNAILTQKVAFNNASRSQAKVFGKTAINHILAHLMYTQLKHNTDNGTLVGVDFSNVYSHSNLTENHTDSIEKNSDKSLLFYSEGNTKYPHSEDIKWQFIKDANGELAGRFAYRILSSEKFGNLDLNQLLKGFYYYGTGKPKPQTYRIGKDISELNINIDNSFFKNVTLDPGETEYDWSKEPLLFANHDAWLSYAFEDTDARITDKEKSLEWLNKWFAPVGNVRTDLEAYLYEKSPDKFIALNRFDIARDDWKKGLGLGESYNNSPQMVERLLMLKNDSNVSGITSLLQVCPTDIRSLPDIGLPYLKRIGTGTEKGGFATLLDLRKQVAANLIDYCDEDSIPTSDIPAAEWNIEDPAKQPKYTGNEKTAYINEVAVGAEVSAAVVNGDKSYNSAIELTVKPELIAELINIYEALKAGYDFKTKLTTEFKFTVTSTWSVNYTDGDGNPQTNDAFVPPAVEVTITNDELEALIEFAAQDTNGTGYRISGKELVAKNGAAQFDFAGITGNITNATLKKFSVKATYAKAQFKGMLLTDKTSGKNVDFIAPGFSLEATATAPYLFNTSSQTATEIEWDSLSDDAKTLYNRFYLVGLEVRDPRQNLNYSDWQCLPRLMGHDAKLDASLSWTSFELDNTKSALAERLKAGKCNTASNPSGGVTNLADTETVTDPAWQSDTTHLSTAYIANEPMRSLWELGAIHRGIPWQTINLKKAPNVTLSTMHNVEISAGADGYTYADGDGIILDQVKLVDKGAVSSSGKIDLNRAHDTSTFNEAWDKKLLAAVFAGVRYNQKYKDLHTDNYAAAGTGNEVSITDAERIVDILYNRSATPQWGSRAKLLAFEPEAGRFFYNAFLSSTLAAAMLTDAAQEELIGKTVNLLKAQLDSQPPEVDTLKAVVVVQTLKDIGGEGSEVEIIRFKQDKTEEKKNCKIGRFDAPVADGDGFVYFDEITSEVKMLVTYKLHWEQTDPAKKSYSIKVQQIEYID